MNYASSGNDTKMEHSTSVATTRHTTTTGIQSVIQEYPILVAILICLYVIIFVIGVLGNAMVLHVVIRNRGMRTTTNIFIACLSISDLVICFFAVPFTPLNAILPAWTLGEVMCRLVPYLLTTCVFVSTMISVAIAVDRFLIIVYPHFPRITSLQQKLIIGSVFLLSAFAALPVIIFTKTEADEQDMRQCRESWPTQPAMDMYGWMVLTLQLILPTILIATCYIAISVKLRAQSTMMAANRAGSKVRANLKRNSKINKMLIAMVVIFIGCWLPLDVFHFFEAIIPPAYMLPIFLVVHVIAMSSVMYNPILYGWMNENFNNYFRQAVPCWRASALNARKDDHELTKQTTFHLESTTTTPANRAVISNPSNCIDDRNNEGEIPSENNNARFENSNEFDNNVEGQPFIE